MGIFILAGAVFVLYQAIKAIFEPELPANYHGNWQLEREDADKVRFGQMSKREFIRNMNNGKYRK